MTLAQISADAPIQRNLRVTISFSIEQRKRGKAQSEYKYRIFSVKDIT
jgi:hypothetical protein